MDTLIWTDYTSKLSHLLNQLSISNETGDKLEISTGLRRWIDYTEELRKENGVIFLIGNGASASMASHFAADLAKNGGIRSETFTDLSLITAISNDISYEQVFAEPLRQRGQKNDMLVAISSSGQSKNILAAVTVAIERGITVVTLSSMSDNNLLRKRGMLNLYIPGKTYGDSETCHAAILHYWMDAVETNGHQ